MFETVPPMKYLGRVIASKRVLLGLSRQELADLVGCHEQTVGNWERGENPPPPELQVALAEALQTPLVELAPMIATLAAEERRAS